MSDTYLNSFCEPLPILRHFKSLLDLFFPEIIHTELSVEFFINFLKHDKEEVMLISIFLHVLMPLLKCGIDSRLNGGLEHFSDVYMRSDSSFQ